MRREALRWGGNPAAVAPGGGRSGARIHREIEIKRRCDDAAMSRCALAS